MLSLKTNLHQSAPVFCFSSHQISSDEWRYLSFHIPLLILYPAWRVPIEILLFQLKGGLNFLSLGNELRITYNYRWRLTFSHFIKMNELGLKLPCTVVERDVGRGGKGSAMLSRDNEVGGAPIVCIYNGVPLQLHRPISSFRRPCKEVVHGQCQGGYGGGWGVGKRTEEKGRWKSMIKSGDPFNRNSWRKNTDIIFKLYLHNQNTFTPCREIHLGKSERNGRRCFPSKSVITKSASLFCSLSHQSVLTSEDISPPSLCWYSIHPREVPLTSRGFILKDMSSSFCLKFIKCFVWSWCFFFFQLKDC